MENLKSYSIQDLKEIKAELEKTVEAEGEIEYNGIKLNRIHYDKDKDLFTVYFYEKTKLKDLIDKYSGEKIFKDEFQTEKYRFDFRNLGFVQSVFNEYQRLEARLAKIKTELSNRKYGIAPFKNKDLNKNVKPKLIKRIEQLCIEHKLPKNKTVDSKIVNLFLRKVQEEGLTKTNLPQTIRKNLSRLGYSKEQTT